MKVIFMEDVSVRAEAEDKAMKGGRDDCAVGAP